MNIEDELRMALQREAAPRAFAAGVLSKTRRRFWQRPAVVAMAAGLAVAALIPSVVSEHQRREEVRGREAKRELFIALTVTRTKLLHVKEEVQRSTRRAL